MNEYLKPLVGAHVFLIKDGQIFLTRRANKAFGNGLYSLPAGHVDEGEFVNDACVREALEEAGITLDPAHIQFVHVVHVAKRERPDRLQFFFVATEWEGEPHNAEPEFCDDAKWFPLNELPENMVGYAAQAIRGWQSGSPYSTYVET